MRYTSTGLIDTGFGGGDGMVTIDFGGSDTALDVALMPGGKIVVVGAVEGNSGLNFGIARLNPTGTLDTIFSGDGKATVDFGGSDAAHDVAIQADGKIVVAGYASDANEIDHFAVARLNNNGLLDTTFSTDGKLTINMSLYGSRVIALALQADGKLILAGYAKTSSTYGPEDFAIVRIHANGALDGSFSYDARVTISFYPYIDKASSVVIQPDGKIVVAGWASDYVLYSDDIALARLNTDGSLDRTFYGDGKVTFDLTGGMDGVFDVAIQSDGKIVAAGYACPSPTQCDFGVVRLSAGGSLDTTFSDDGVATVDFGSNEGAEAIAQQADGKIVVAGRSLSGSSSDFLLARLQATSSP
jgi:uncharacterized delta-60 repeat protein